MRHGFVRITMATSYSIYRNSEYSHRHNYYYLFDAVCRHYLQCALYVRKTHTSSPFSWWIYSGINQSRRMFRGTVATCVLLLTRRASDKQMCKGCDTWNIEFKKENNHRIFPRRTQAIHVEAQSINFFSPNVFFIFWSFPPVIHTNRVDLAFFTANLYI